MPEDTPGVYPVTRDQLEAAFDEWQRRVDANRDAFASDYDRVGGSRADYLIAVLDDLLGPPAATE